MYTVYLDTTSRLEMVDKMDGIQFWCAVMQEEQWGIAEDIVPLNPLSSEVCFDNQLLSRRNRK